VHHEGQLRDALAGNGVQHVHLLLPLPAAAGHDDHLLHQDLHADLQMDDNQEL